MTTNAIRGANILITGGAGFVGSFLVEELLPYQPANIYILDNLFRGSYENMRGFLDHPAVEFIHDDIRHQEVVDRYMAKSEYCFHLAALRINACAADPQAGYDVMIHGTFHVIDSAKRHGIKKLIYSSSASIYGLAQHFPTPETDHPYDNQTFYGAAKLFGEQLLRSYSAMYGLNYIALRYFNIYGPRMDTDGKYTEVMIKWLDCIRENRPPLIYGDGSTTMDFVHVQDVARANVLALLSEQTDETCNIACERETSLKELLDLLLSLNHSSLQPEYRPENTVNPVTRRLGRIEKAAKLLGYTPTIPLEQGLEDLSEWYFAKKGRATHIS
ncbi:NAD-dependent epimerase/dehydratase family protein [candidate division KSB3 bacterium]|uniref:NAD-dependent epimerase/dehydratase family protein n=1 Tax=candidate division KSB3 bacterium TaxID=2044937 RepID=A0A9D5Q847_9BACT|nr:NAD-dependent epimerase/dehydratase family protein [candidate division KSB3 bacterium]MBD3326967.1 NAD-dependent epimerase/dehydratase family protein [candidate division KSB3 bacterium]